MAGCEEGKSGDPIYSHEQETAHEHHVAQKKKESASSTCPMARNRQETNPKATLIITSMDRTRTKRHNGVSILIGFAMYRAHPCEKNRQEKKECEKEEERKQEGLYQMDPNPSCRQVNQKLLSVHQLSSENSAP